MVKRVPFIVTLFVVNAISGLAAQVQQDTILAYYGRDVFIRVPEEQLSEPGTVSTLSLLLHVQLQKDPTVIPMEKVDGTWVGKYTVQDTSVKIITYAFQTTDKNGKVIAPLLINGDYGDILMAGEDGTPVRGAYYNLALSCIDRNGFRPENPEKAYWAITEGLRLYPRYRAAQLLKYGLELRMSTEREQIKEEIATEVEQALEDDTSAGTMSFAVSAFRLLGERDRAEKLVDELIEQYPQSEAAAQRRFSEIMKIDDTKDRAARLDEFLAEVTVVKFRETAWVARASAAIELDDKEKMVQAARELLNDGKTPAAASGLAGLAGAFSEKQTELPLAEECALQAVALIREAADMSGPEEMSEREWQDQAVKTEGRYLDILGWIKVLRNDVPAGTAFLEDAVKKVSDPGIYLHLGRALERQGQDREALIQLGRAANFDGEIGSIAYDEFLTLWWKTGGDTTGAESFLNEQGVWLAERFRTEVLASREVRAAPDFELQDILSGEWVRLQDQRGVVTVVAFWAAWSRSSHFLLQTLSDLADRYGGDVLFLTVAVDASPAPVRNYINKYKLLLPVLLSQGCERDFGIRGVPMTYVIDKGGFINFSHRGFRPDLAETMAVELDDLLGGGMKDAR